MGTSSIGFIKIGTTGPTGPTGNTGLRGATGTGTGKTGITGPAGFYVAVVNGFVDPILTFLNNGTLFQIFGTKGPTGFTGTIFGSNGITGLSLYSGFSGYTLNVRGLTFIGNLQAQISGNSIVVTPLDVSYGVTLASTVKDSTVIYAKTDNTLDSTRIVYGKTYGDFSFSDIAGITENSTYLNVNTNVTEIFGGNNVILGVTNFGIYKIHTPIGLSGFTLNPTQYNNNELISVTLFIEGNGFSQFPSNVYFSDSPYSSYFGCGTNIMNIMTPDKGTNWYATIVERGYGVTRCNQMEGIGSCCYLEGNTLTCNEYVTEDWCTEKAGTYNAFTPCDSACGVTSICCSNGNCVSGVSESECIYFGGKYYRGIPCDNTVYENQPNTVRQCYRSDLESTVCCTGGQCIPDVTYKICQDYYNGVPFTGTCCELNCNANPPRKISGACCIESRSTCSEMTPAECNATGGIFFGDGITCGDVNCCFPPLGDTGSCCIPGNSCEITTREQCTDSEAIFTKGGNCESCISGPADVRKGLCCGREKAFTNVTKQECLAENPENYYFPNPIFNHRADVVYDWRSAGLVDESDPTLGETGGDCDFCKGVRKVYTQRHHIEFPANNDKNVSLYCVYNRPRDFDVGLLGINPDIDFTNKKKIQPALFDISEFNPSIDLNWWNIGNNSKFNTIMTAPCGAGVYNQIINQEEYNARSFLDSFSMGHIFAYKITEPFYEVISVIPENPTREQLRQFIYDKYLTEVVYVYLDYAIKVCRSGNGHIPVNDTTSPEDHCWIDCFNFQAIRTCCISGCDFLAINHCDFMKLMALNFSGLGVCSTQCSGDCVDQNPSPESIEFYRYFPPPTGYCSKIYPLAYSGPQLSVSNDSDILVDCDPFITVNGDRCSPPSGDTCEPGLNCYSVDCINDPNNPCYNLQDCTPI